jgi:hypothetical protein
MKISLVCSTRNNLKYLKWSYDSVRKNQGQHEVWLCYGVDHCTDGTLEWLQELSKTDAKVKFIVNNTGHRLGHTVMYDKIVYELVETDLAMIWHSDMYLCKGALDAIESLIEPNTIVSLTRIEPPLHPSGPEKIVKDFGTEPENFDEVALVNFVQRFTNEIKLFGTKVDKNLSPQLTTDGVFAPWCFWVSEFKEMGGHDWLYKPQSKEDCVKYDTLVFVEIDGVKQLLTINDLWNRYWKEDIELENGNRAIDLTDKNINVLSPKSNGDFGFEKLNGLVWKEVNSSRLYNVKTIWGVVTVTDDHSLIDNNCNAVKVHEINECNQLWKPVQFIENSKSTIDEPLTLKADWFNLSFITEKVLNYILNLSEDYQKIFLDGYFNEHGSVNSDWTKWELTSKSKFTISAINFLLRKCFPNLITEIIEIKNTRNEVFYTVSAFQGNYKNPFLQIAPHKTNSNKTVVFDLEVANTHTFIGGIGLIGLHNSDIFNRYQLKHGKNCFKQTWQGFVYHLTCRGSRYNPTLTQVGMDSAEWSQQNNRSYRNFIRKWHSLVKHTDTLEPIVSPVYHTTFIIHNCSFIDKFEIWCDKLILPNCNKNYIEAYINEEQPNTDFDLRAKIHNYKVDFDVSTDVIVEFDMQRFDQHDFNNLVNLSDIIAQSGEVGEFELGNLKVKILKMQPLEQSLIAVKNKNIDLN